MPQFTEFIETGWFLPGNLQTADDTPSWCRDQAVLGNRPEAAVCVTPYPVSAAFEDQESKTAAQHVQGAVGSETRGPRVQEITALQLKMWTGTTTWPDSLDWSDWSDKQVSLLMKRSTPSTAPTTLRTRLQQNKLWRQWMQWKPI